MLLPSVDDVIKDMCIHYTLQVLLPSADDVIKVLLSGMFNLLNQLMINVVCLFCILAGAHMTTWTFTHR